MTIYKPVTEGRIYSPKSKADSNTNSTQVSQTQPLQPQAQRCSECTNSDCRDANCDCRCDCEAQDGAVRIQGVRRNRPCSTWALTAVCTVTVALSFLLIGLLYMATRTEFRSQPAMFCQVMYGPEADSNQTYPETITVEEEQDIEMIDVPEFSNQHHITVMSDFRIQLTAFRDNVDENCFLLKHNNSLFESPRNVLEFMKGYKNGDHLTQLDTVYARMEVQGPAIDVTLMATSVRDHCFQRSTFWLQASEVVETSRGSIVKRSADNQFVPQRSFIFFNGKKRVHIDLDQ